MSLRSTNDILDRFTSGIIRRKASQLVGRAGFTKSDQEGLQQELYVRVLQSLPRFNPQYGHRNAFITTVVERHAANIVRNKRAAKRDPRRVTSLNVTVNIHGDDLSELSQMIEATKHGERLGRQVRSEEERSQLAMDLAELARSLPKQWQTFLHLRRTMSMSEAAREMGVPRTTLNGWMRRIRQRFEQAGMRDYL